MAQYEHRDANNCWHSFSHGENEIIERAYRANKNRNKVHLTMPLNPAGFREFEVRFGADARSKKMPRPPSTKIIQVNVASGATRVVRRVVPIDQPTMGPTLQNNDPIGFFEGGPYCWECCDDGNPCWCVCLCGPLTLEEKQDRLYRRAAARSACGY